MTAAAPSAVPSAVLAGWARAEAVMVLANMTMSALESTLDGGDDERRGEDRQYAPRPAGGDLSAAVVDGAGARARGVHHASVRPGRGGGRAGLAPHRRGGDRHRPGCLGPLGRGPGRIRRAGGPGVFR